jgi:hypothetical protein
MKLGITCSVACGLLLGAGSAYGWANHSTSASASDPLSSIRAEMRACGKEPVSYRGICKAQVNRDVDARYASVPVAVLVIEPAFVEPDRALANTEMNRYRSLSSSCSRAPGSERDACMDAASLRLARPARLS